MLRSRYPLRLFVFFVMVAIPGEILSAHTGVLDRRALLKNETFWDNRDFDWYATNIPFFECPDKDIQTTYYYRWDLMAKHLVYGSPEHGYAFTEFIDRPFWSGTYGAISCPSGLQLSDIRWYRDPTFARDYAEYWFRVPGAQPRRYSSWLADSTWQIHQIHPNDAFTTGMLEPLVGNYKGWEETHWVPQMNMFWQTGHDDGMEININSRQTRDTVRGAPGYRPTLNAYLYADALAIARIAELAGKSDLAKEYQAKAASLRKQVQEHLWDEDRGFFFHMFRDREKRDGHVVEPLTLTHESGQYAGSPHGRELIGYVPWQFNLPDEGYEEAWKFLMEPEYFYAAYGPTTVERGDPMFHISPHCCVWSGNSWPYATTQTLEAFANLLNNYAQEHVDKEDYTELLRIYARTHRKDGKPYLAEALHPDTGSFEGHDNYNHSEHYFHSGYINLVITGLVGLRPQDGDRVVVNPLAPDDWDYFALDYVPYKGHTLTILWDPTGERYGKGKGLTLFADGRQIARRADLGRLEAELKTRQVPRENRGGTRRVNVAVNNTGEYFPRAFASFTNFQTPLSKLNDGQFWFLQSPPNRWTTEGTHARRDSVGIDFGAERRVDELRLHFLDDGEGAAVRPPSAYRVEHWTGSEWVEIEDVEKAPETPEGRRANTVRFPAVETSKVRVVMHHRPESVSGLSEFEAWGEATLPLSEPEGFGQNLALNPDAEGFPKASASWTSRYDEVEEANDGRIAFTPGGRNRWTAYESQSDTDWLQVDFGKPIEANAVFLYIFDDRGGVQRPESYLVQYNNGGEWKPVPNPRHRPRAPTGGTINEAHFDTVNTDKLRVLFKHRGSARSGVTEMEVYKLEE